MSPLSNFMRAASAFLDCRDDQRVAPRPDQPPIFVRTNWLFIEIDEAHENAARLVQQIKIARINCDVTGAARLVADLLIISKQAAQLASIANDQFLKDASHGN